MQNSFTENCSQKYSFNDVSIIEFADEKIFIEKPQNIRMHTAATTRKKASQQNPFVHH